MNKTIPRVIFVDGPNAVGKDHAIAAITQNLNSKGYNTLQYDVRKHLPAFIKSKRFFTFNFYEADKLALILEAHLNSVDDIAEMLSNSSDSTVIVVNRSFLTALIYNYGVTESVRGLRVASALMTYREHFKATITVPTHVAIISEFYDFPYPLYGERYTSFLSHEVNHFKKKIIARGQDMDNVEFNDEYIEYLMTAYRSPSIMFIGLFDTATFTSSSNLEPITDKYGS